MRKRLLIIVATFTLLTLTLAPSLSFAEPHSTTPSELKEKQRKYLETKKQVESLQRKIAVTDDRLSKTFQSLERLKDQQVQTKQNLKQVFVRYYTLGQHHLGAQLLSSESVSQFFHRLEIIRLIVDRDMKVLAEYQQQEKLISEQQQSLQKELRELKPLLKETEKKEKQLFQEYQSLTAHLEKEKEKEKEKKKQENTSNETVETTQKTEQTVDQSWLYQARSMIGTVKYVFGADSYPNFDCSSWTKYVFKKYRGIQLPRTAAAQSKIGVFVPKSELQPGDLVFFQGTYKSGVSHVGIYLGNGKYISNKNSRLHLRIDSLHDSYSKKHYWGAKRVNS